ncbi:MAG: flagellin [Deferrisomatales bacterium]|nr:flagellin [Deferrisomatales bacterium]
MSLMINQNITALNAWRNLAKTDREMSNTMEKLSSGLRINKAADDPSGLVISEQMRAQVVGLNAAMKNSEKGISMIQTAEAALDKMHNLLDKMRGLAIDSANNATSDDNMLAANQAEIDNIIATINRISDNTQYGTKKLLDGTNANGSTVTSAAGTGITTSNITDVTGLDDGVYNLVVTENTPGTGVFTDTDGTNATMVTTSADAALGLSEGTHALVISGDTYEAIAADVPGAGNTGLTDMTTAGTFTGGSDLTYVFTVTGGGTAGTDALTFSWTDGAGGSGNIAYSAGDVITGDTAGLQGVTFTLSAATVVADDTYTVAATASNMTASLDGGTVSRLISTADNSAVALTSGLTGGGTATFNLDNVTAVDAGSAAIVVTKTTYDATLTEAATGTSGPAVTGFKAGDGEQTFTVDSSKSMTVNMSSLSAAGTIEFTNTDNSLVFQVGANQGQTVKIAIQDVSADTLAVGVTQPHDSGFASLAEIEINTADKATDALGLIDRAIDQISVIRGNLGAFQANTLEANLDSLRVAAENLQASESVIRDTDMAAEMATFTKYQIMLQAGTSMLAQANQIPQNLLQLLQ